MERRKFQPIIFVIAVLAAAIMPGCAIDYGWRKAYEGPELALDKVAVLAVPNNVMLHEVDDKAGNYVRPALYNRVHLMLLPGKHRIKASYRQGYENIWPGYKMSTVEKGVFSSSPVVLGFEAKAGFYYFINPNVHSPESPDDAMWWKPSIDDEGRTQTSSEIVPPHLRKPFNPEISEAQREWEKIDRFDTQSLERFIGRYPSWGQSDEIKLRIELNRRIDKAEQTGGTIIPFSRIALWTEELAKEWDDWEKTDSSSIESLKAFLERHPKWELSEAVKLRVELLRRKLPLAEQQKQTVILYAMAKKTGRETGQYIGDRVADQSVRTALAEPVFGPMDRKGFPCPPFGDRTIIVFDTHGREFKWPEGGVFISDEDNPLYFGVLRKYGGFVLLKGRGKYISADGQEIKLSRE